MNFDDKVQAEIEKLDALNEGDIFEDRTISQLVTKEVASNILSKDRLLGYPTRFEEFNRMIKGIRAGTLVVLVADRGTGKTLFALNILLDLAEQNVKSVIFDLENGKDLTFERLIKIKYQLNSTFFEKEATPEYLIDLAGELDKISYYDSPDLVEMAVKDLYGKPESKIDTLLRIIEEQAQNDYKVFLVDPLQALTDGKASELTQSENVLMSRFREISMKYGVTIIICHHLRKGNRGGDYISKVSEVEETKYIVPTLESVKGAGAITDWATDVWGLVRSYASASREERSMTAIKILKNRSGLTGDVFIQLDEDTLTFKDRERNIIDKIFGKDAIEIGGDSK